jgi:hypothetical protein
MAQSNNTACCGCGGGGTFLVAAVMSYLVNHSILWAIIHGFCNIVYIIYWLIVKLPNLK